MANENNIEFSSYEVDAVGEILNISMGSAATAVSELLNAKTWITTPQVNVLKVGDLNYDNLEPAICVKIVYVQGITGLNMMVLKQNDVQLILNQLLGNPLVIDPDFQFDELNISAVSEIMNQMMGASATALSDLLGTTVDISVPTPYIIEKTKFGDLCDMDLDETVVAVTFQLTVDGVMQSEFMSVMSLELAKTLSGMMMEKFQTPDEEPAPEPQPAAPQQPASQQAVPQQAVPQQAVPPQTAPQAPMPGSADMQQMYGQVPPMPQMAQGYPIGRAHV